MNFLAEVLSSAEEVEIHEINEKVPEIKLTIENTKSEVVRYIENVYVKCSGRPKQNRILLNKAHDIEEEIKTLRKNAEHATKKELLEAGDLLKKHIASLENINFTLLVVSKLCHLNELLINFTELLDSEMYLDCMKAICHLEELANAVPEEEYVDIIDELNIIINTKKNMLLKEIKDVFTNNIILIENRKQNSVAVKLKRENSNLEQALQALYYTNSMINQLHDFAKSLWNYFFIPIVDSTVKIVVDEDDSYYILSRFTLDPQKEVELYTASLFEYANNVDVLFINKKCQNYLLNAQAIMKKDLHDMVEVGTPYNPDTPLGCNVDEFLQCWVSKSAIENEISQLQKVASEVFSTYLDGQIKQISEIMKEAELDQITLEKLEPITEKCIRQCFATAGIIENRLAQSSFIYRFEDISSNAAEQLVEIIKIILIRGPKLFTDPKEVSLYVSSWYKIMELNFVLGASLLDINDRWADGKGPLALQFKPLELKQLIRALFQNTDRRSAVLARIQE
ncbi:hypothetical protein NQ317_015399 [Molorchus minor]|uniref:ZW10 C-terminal helical domain-containing protein n=1 Tax=Molorchus minor TaxID=1323400 RepID=A0ABQ9IS25_9CUCU|nr:hypothetical protein NQ317_015399 [Molorchus minor]